MRNKLSILPVSAAHPNLFVGLAVAILLSIFIGIATELYFLAGFPAFLLLAYVCIVDFRKAFISYSSVSLFPPRFICPMAWQPIFLQNL